MDAAAATVGAALLPAGKPRARALGFATEAARAKCSSKWKKKRLTSSGPAHHPCRSGGYQRPGHHQRGGPTTPAYAPRCHGARRCHQCPPGVQSRCCQAAWSAYHHLGFPRQPAGTGTRGGAVAGAAVSSGNPTRPLGLGLAGRHCATSQRAGSPSLLCSVSVTSTLPHVANLGPPATVSGLKNAGRTRLGRGHAKCGCCRACCVRVACARRLLPIKRFHLAYSRSLSRSRTHEHYTNTLPRGPRAAAWPVGRACRASPHQKTTPPCEQKRACWAGGALTRQSRHPARPGPCSWRTRRRPRLRRASRTSRTRRSCQ